LTGDQVEHEAVGNTEQVRLLVEQQTQRAVKREREKQNGAKVDRHQRPPHLGCLRRTTDLHRRLVGCQAGRRV